MKARLPNPNGCRWCGIDARSHAQRWKPPKGWHQWEQPTQEQIKDRMRARRAARPIPSKEPRWTSTS